MRRTTLSLTDEQFSALRARSQETGAPIAELIRRAIDESLRNLLPSRGDKLERKHNGAQFNESKR